MWNVVAQSKAGSLAASVVASVDVDTRRLCPPDPWDSMRHQAPVVLAVDSEVALVEEASVGEASAVTAVVTVEIALDPAVELVTKEAAMASVDSRLQMLPLAQVVVDVVGSEAATVVEEEETDSTVAVLAATESPSGPEIATLTVTVVTATVTATETVTACQTAMETVAETVAAIVAETATGIVIVSVTGMAAERITDGSDTVRMMNATTRDLGGDTIKCPSSLFSHGSYSFPLLSPDMLVGIPDFSVVRPFLYKVKGVRRELKRCIGKSVRDVQCRMSIVPNPRRKPPLLLF